MSDVVTLALITALPPTIAAVAAFVVSLRTDRKAQVLGEKATVLEGKSDQIHNLVNSKMDAIKQDVVHLQSALATTRLELAESRKVIQQLEDHIIAMTREAGES
jgi:hypothetical protein